MDGARPQPDFTVSNYGTVWVFNAESDAAIDFAHGELGLEGWQFVGADSFAIDHSIAGDLVLQLREEGWIIERP